MKLFFMARFTPIMALVLLMAACGGESEKQDVSNDPATTSFTVTPSDKGWYTVLGDHTPTTENTATGMLLTSAVYYRSFFTFDLSGVTGTTVVNPVLRLGVYSMQSVVEEMESFCIYEVSTDVTTLVAGGTGLTAIYDDLGTDSLGGGANYGCFDVLISDVGSGTPLTIPLNASAAADLSAALGGSFSIGIAGSSLDPVGGAQNVVFSYGDATDAERIYDLQLDTY
ncbi:MAG: hypothetical protein OEZ59_05615 [Deltaproteobacteria bacterium]|nr:hypothetical protein [Deltaproteobacteria bacterium]